MISTGPAIILVGEEAQQFDPVHSGHAEVERHHLRALVEEAVAEILVAVGGDGVEAAHSRRACDECRKLRLVIDQ